MEARQRIRSAAELLARVAVIFSALLLLSGLPLGATHANVWLSAFPLDWRAIAYTVLQIRLRSGKPLKRLVLAAAFVLWAFDQIVPVGRVATFIGDAVISAYVLDLFWLMQEQSQAETKFE
jgi:hypothetical protein